MTSAEPPAQRRFGRPTLGPVTRRGRRLLRSRGVAGVVRRAEAGVDAVRNRGGASAAPRGVVFTGSVWTGGAAQPFPGVIVVDGSGRVVRCGPADAIAVPPDLPAFGGDGHWIGPGVIDAHVHLAFGGLEDSLAAGVVGVRDLGAPAGSAHTWRTGHRRPAPGRPFIATSGPVLTAPQGYPSASWGSAGFARFVSSPADARIAVQNLAADGADLIKLALEPRHGWTVPGPAVVRAVVDAAHASGLAVVAHALTAAMVARAVDAGVDELAHTPTERLDDELVARLAAAGMSVTSTLQTFFAEGVGRDAAANATALVQAGVPLRYGTDLGNTGTRAGVDPRELDRLADAGLGRLGALRAATTGSAQAAGMRRRTGLIRVGEWAALVVLPGDPLSEPGAWRTPVVVLADGRLARSPAAPHPAAPHAT